MFLNCSTVIQLQGILLHPEFVVNNWNQVVCKDNINKYSLHFQNLNSKCKNLYNTIYRFCQLTVTKQLILVDSNFVTKINIFPQFSFGVVSTQPTNQMQNVPSSSTNELNKSFISVTDDVSASKTSVVISQFSVLKEKKKF
ncbi:Hypothetical_protein [Hexamita inflata]|uniref:Hypothetical_protein n=1 Tax=Hexamita inflata TaxID=28002 RepID=A0AA86QSD6_9EUKA|nr:Hypothetical protein HINF_LOCUS46014 [Hexamita inflata]